MRLREQPGTGERKMKQPNGKKKKEKTVLFQFRSGDTEKKKGKKDSRSGNTVDAQSYPNDRKACRLY